MKLDFSNVGKGLEAIAKAKRESDYQEALKEREAEWERRQARAALEPERQQEGPRFYSLEGQGITEDLVGPQELPSITGRGLEPSYYYTLPGEEARYETLSAARAARGKAPTAWEKSQAKADIAEQMGLYDRAKDLRAASLQAMQSKAAELELESKSRRAELTDAFYYGGGVQGVLDKINDFTGGNLTVEQDKNGVFTVYDTQFDNKGRASRVETGLTFGSPDEAFEYALALTSPDSLAAFYKDRRATETAARERQYTRLKDESDTLVNLIEAERKAVPPDPKKLEALYTKLSSVQGQLQRYRGTDGSSMAVAAIDQILADRGAGGGLQAGVQGGQPQVEMPQRRERPRGAEESRLGAAVRGGVENLGFMAKMDDLKSTLAGISTSKSGLPSPSGFGQVYGFIFDNPEEEKVREKAGAISDWLESPEGDAYFYNNPEILDSILAGQVTLESIYDIAKPQKKRNGGLIRGYEAGGTIGKAKEAMSYVNDPAERQQRIRQAKANADEVDVTNAKERAKREDKKERMAALSSAYESLSGVTGSGGSIGEGLSSGYGDFGDAMGMLAANRVQAPQMAAVDPNAYLRYMQARRGGGLIHDYRRGGHTAKKGTETSDSILARVSKNEYVVNAESMKIPGVPELLEHINKMGLQKRKAKTRKA